MRRVLVFDDDPQVCDLLELALTETGYAVSRAARLAEARDALQREAIDLALIDMPMFKFSGVEFGKYAAARGVKVLMMAAGEDAGVRADAAGLPYVLKPLRLADIMKAMADLVES